jgi:AraC-like DNA-binding protein
MFPRDSTRQSHERGRHMTDSPERPRTHDARVAGRGQVCFWPGGSLWIGTALRGADAHAHHAIQIPLALDGAVRFRRASDPEWTTYRGCMIPPDLPHAFDASGETVAHLFVDPETVEGHALRSRLAAYDIVALPEPEREAACDALTRAWAGPRSCHALAPVAREVIRSLAGTLPQHVSTDPRVLGAIELIRARIGGPVALGEVARELNISPSRLRHLFVDEVGLPFRTYVLWQRLFRVFDARTAGATLTEAALAAGFADAAHMTRTFRRMFGMAPSALQQEE